MAAPPDAMHLVFEHDRARHTMRATRSEHPIATVEDVDAMVLATSTYLESAGRAHLRLLVDLRHASLREETLYADAMRRLRATLCRGCERVVILVKTAIGRLQVRRFLREEGLDAEVVDTEAEALRLIAAP